MAPGAVRAHALPFAIDPDGLALSRLDRRVCGHRIAGICGGALVGFGAFFSGARRLGAVLLILGVPAEGLFFYAYNALTATGAYGGQLAVTTELLFGADLG
jgi:hypothetical protein